MKNLKISTELASAVLGKEVTKCNLLSTARNSINITYFEDKEDFNTIWIEWNIYEFAFKCKEWALKQGYFIYSTNELSFIKSFSLETIETFSNGKDTEIECILKASEYIYIKGTK